MVRNMAGRYVIYLALLVWLTAACQAEPHATPLPTPEPTATRRVQRVAFVATPDAMSQAEAVAGSQPSLGATITPIASPTPQPEATAPPPSATATPVSKSPSRVEARRFESQALGRAMDYLIYLPPGYESQKSLRYPVLYMLHGAGDDNGPSVDEWWNLGLLDQADVFIEQGQIKPLLIVLPQGDLGYWMNHADNGPRYGTYLAQDVVTEIDTNFRTVADAAYRAVGGLSMGADGALQLALNYPEVFGIAGAHSPTLPRPGFAPDFYGDRDYYDGFDPLALALARPDVARSLRLWLDVGANDPRLVNATTFHELLLDLSVPHEWRTGPGEHHWNYWLANVGEYLLYYASALGEPWG